MDSSSNTEGVFYFFVKSQNELVIPCVYTELLQLLVHPIRRHFENRKGPDSHLPENGLSPIFEISRMLLRVSDVTKMKILATS